MQKNSLTPVLFPSFHTTQSAKKSGLNYRTLTPVKLLGTRIRGVRHDPNSQRTILLPHALAQNLEHRERFTHALALKTRKPHAAVVGHHAAYLLGAPIAPPDLPLTTITPRHLSSKTLAGFQNTRSQIRARFDFYGASLIPPEWVVAQLAFTMNVAELVEIIDFLLGPWRTDPVMSSDSAQQARRALAAFRTYQPEEFARARNTLTQAWSLARVGVESVRETQTRLLLVDAGLPCPEVQYPIYIPQLDTYFHVDMAYPELLLAIEYEGSHHFHDPHVWQRDVERYNPLAKQGWRVLRITAEHSPALTLRYVRSYFYDL